MPPRRAAMSDDSLLAALDVRLAALPRGALCVGFSGGGDSTALLHALAALPRARARDLSAIHVDHGLHPQSSQWAEHCASLCAQLEVPLRVERVQVTLIDELGVEAAARRARHAAFARCLGEHDVLALAHHQDDQAETLLLRLLHGAGQEGLAGMRALRPLARGWLWRPWLDLSREQLRLYRQRHALDAIEDPANTDPQFARTHLRRRVLPALAQRWPDAAHRIAAAAARLREESEVLDRCAIDALAQAQRVDPAVLAIDALRALAPALARRVLGRWLDQLGLPRPPARVWPRVLPELIDARPDATPMLAWRGAELRRYRDNLHAMAPLAPVDAAWERIWRGDAALVLPAGFGRLALEPAIDLGAIRVRARRGGERLRQPGAHRELRTLLQDLGVPPWIRARLPLLYLGEELVAAGDLALAPDFAATLRERGTRLRWQSAA
jgi:tRNA(Ile)-lysidine synthase